MTTLLAQLPDPNSYTAIGWFIVIGVAVIAGVNQAAALVARFKEKPSPPETYVTKVECRAVHTAQDQRIQKLDCEVAAIRAEFKEAVLEISRVQEARAVALHNRINDVLAAVSEVKGKVER